MEKWLISVIVPMYNVEKYIGQCLESLIKQTHRNLEIIVINDGSTDKSMDAAQKYATDDNRIKIYDFANAGVSEARNRGLRIAQGEYIAFVDSDDWIAENMYSKLLECALKYNLDMVKCSVCETDTRVKRIIVPDDRNVKNECDVGGNTGSLLKKYYFEGLLWKIMWNGLYKRELALKVKFPKGLCFEDNYSAGMYLFYASKIMLIEDVLYYYRINLAGISKSGPKRPLDIAFVTEKLIRDLINNGFNDTAFINKLYEKLAREIFHFIRLGKDSRFKIIKIDKNLYNWLCKKLDLRRNLVLKYLVSKYNIKIG